MVVLSTIDNEKTRLTATLFNTVAAAMITVGLIIPFADILLRDANVPNVIGSAMYVMAAVILHWRARKQIDRLEHE